MSDDDSWTDFHEDRVARGDFPRWPNETMVKTIFGNRLDESPDVDETWSVLDVGTGFGNNLLPFLEAGCRCAGVEIDEDIAEVTTDVLRERGYEADVREGTNRDLPFEDDSFDLLLSVNVLHYEGTREGVRAGLAEYARVLKPSGYLYLMTTGPGHDIYQRAEPLDNHQYVMREAGFRSGETMFYFDTEKYLRLYLDDYFERIRTGKETVTLGNSTEEYLLGVGQMPR